MYTLVYSIFWGYLLRFPLWLRICLVFLNVPWTYKKHYALSLPKYLFYCIFMNSVMHTYSNSLWHWLWMAMGQKRETKITKWIWLSSMYFPFSIQGWIKISRFMGLGEKWGYTLGYFGKTFRQAFCSSISFPASLEKHGVRTLFILVYLICRECWA